MEIKLMKMYSFKKIQNYHFNLFYLKQHLGKLY